MHRLRRRQMRRRPRDCLSTTPFKISKDLFADPGNHASLLLLKLPTEIIIHIFHQMDYIVDSISLAMSCKALLRISALCELGVPNPNAHIATWVPRPPNQDTKRCSCVNMEFILQRTRPRDARGLPSRAWNICVDCMKCLPTRKSYWNTVQEEPDFAELVVKDGEKWKQSINYFSNGIRLQCPSCVMREQEFLEEFLNRPRIEGPPLPPENQDNGHQ